MMNKLPERLEKEYNEIKREFAKVWNDWEKYNDQIIPEDKAFAKRIVEFWISVIDYVLDNFDSVDVKQYQAFLGNYDLEFSYGPHGDDSNYLDFDERADGERVTEFCWDLKDPDFKLTKEKLLEIKAKYSKVLGMLKES
ncbi:hypothetical protein KY319_01920 [Candidatus Woesearchaeota archaeon]|nr:hypothetical protein [Candidatus Woesearchaeota archaeon]